MKHKINIFFRFVGAIAVGVCLADSSIEAGFLCPGLFILAGGLFE